jgi:manganese transport protein
MPKGGNRHASGLRQTLSYLGPGFIVAVGFVDPGNWATNVAAGSDFGYDLLWVVTLSTLILILWQHISAHLGIMKGKCLAEAVHEHMRPLATAVYGITAMLACVATAAAEILGAAIGLYVLLRIPITVGAIAAAVVVGVITWSERYRPLEKVIVVAVALIGLCYLVELSLVKPDWGQTGLHLVVPKLSSQSIVIATAVLGAVVMPHNMYLHSEVIQSRQWKAESEAETRRLLRFEFVDTLLAMLSGLAINAAMVIVAAAVFHRHGIHVSELPQAAETLRPLAGPLASLLFGIGLVLSGGASAVTACIAGGTTFSGYLGKSTELRSPPFRAGVLLTLIPACGAILLVHDTFRALIASQVCLSVQLPFTMLPLFLLTTSRKVMGRYANSWAENLGMVLTGLPTLLLNGLLIWQSEFTIHRGGDQRRGGIAGPDHGRIGLELGAGELDHYARHELEDAVGERWFEHEHHHELRQPTGRAGLGERHVDPANDEALISGRTGQLRYRSDSIGHAAAGLRRVRPGKPREVGPTRNQGPVGIGGFVVRECHLGAEIGDDAKGVRAGRDSIETIALANLQLRLRQRAAIGRVLTVRDACAIGRQKHQQREDGHAVGHIAADSSETASFACHLMLLRQVHSSCASKVRTSVPRFQARDGLSCSWRQREGRGRGRPN